MTFFRSPAGAACSGRNNAYATGASRGTSPARTEAKRPVISAFLYSSPQGRARGGGEKTGECPREHRRIPGQSILLRKNCLAPYEIHGSHQANSVGFQSVDALAARMCLSQKRGSKDRRPPRRAKLRFRIHFGIIACGGNRRVFVVQYIHGAPQAQRR